MTPISLFNLGCVKLGASMFASEAALLPEDTQTITEVRCSDPATIKVFDNRAGFCQSLLEVYQLQEEQPTDYSKCRQERINVVNAVEYTSDRIAVVGTTLTGASLLVVDSIKPVFTSDFQQ